MAPAAAENTLYFKMLQKEIAFLAKYFKISHILAASWRKHDPDSQGVFIWNDLE